MPNRGGVLPNLHGQQQAARDSESCKVVVRQLPPLLPETVFWKSTAQWVNDGSADWKTYRPGHFATSSHKEDAASIAYIHFKSLSALLEFNKAFNLHQFRDAKGNISIAKVEFAPLQRIPNLEIDKKVDKLQGTIEQDDEFATFLKALETPDEPETGELKLPKPTTTPLLEHLRAQKAAKISKKILASPPAMNRTLAAEGSTDSKRPDTPSKSDRSVTPTAKGKNRRQRKPSKPKDVKDKDKVPVPSLPVPNAPKVASSLPPRPHRPPPPDALPKPGPSNAPPVSQPPTAPRERPAPSTADSKGQSRALNRALAGLVGGSRPPRRTPSESASSSTATPGTATPPVVANQAGPPRERRDVPPPTEPIKRGRGGFRPRGGRGRGRGGPNPSDANG